MLRFLFSEFKLEFGKTNAFFRVQNRVCNLVTSDKQDSFVVGVASLAAWSAGQILGALFLYPIAIKFIRAKPILIASHASFLLFAAANFYPSELIVLKEFN